jgi:hypothetical protein
LQLNNSTGFYGVRFHRLATANLVVTDGHLKINLQAMGWQTRIDPFVKKAKVEPSGASKKKKKKWRFTFPMLKALLLTFKIKTCCLDIDTGNVQLNGLLYPVFYWFSSFTTQAIAINFLNHNNINLTIENNIARLIKAYIYSSIKTKNHGKLK